MEREIGWMVHRHYILLFLIFKSVLIDDFIDDDLDTLVTSGSVAAVWG